MGNLTSTPNTIEPKSEKIDEQKNVIIDEKVIFAKISRAN